MPMFKIDGKKLLPIKEVKIDLEKDIQSYREEWINSGGKQGLVPWKPIL